MTPSVYVYDPSAHDELSRVRGVGRYVQILRENFPDWKFENSFENSKIEHSKIFINPFFNFLQPRGLNKRIAKRQIAVIHDLIPLKFPEHFPAGLKGKLNIFRNKQALKNYDIIVTDSEASKRDIIKILRINGDKIKVIYPTLPKIFENSKIENSLKIRKLLAPRSSKSEVGKIENYCIYVGDVTWNKNIANIARAIKIADVKCVFVGKAFSTAAVEDPDVTSGGKTAEVNGWQKEFNEFSNLARDDSRFIFPGFVSDKELISLYKNARVNLLVSRDEGFGFSYLEASSLGIPSILADIPVLQEISSESALYASAEEPNDIALMIKKLLGDYKLRQELSIRAKKRTGHFSADKFKRNFLELID